MSDFKVPLTKVLAVNPHSNADRLEVLTIYGFQVIAQKGKYSVGDGVIYVPVDSILPSWLEKQLFPEDSKIKLHGSRVRQIRIRKLASQGMLIGVNEVASKVSVDEIVYEEDLSEKLGIIKYDPPQPGFAQTQGVRRERTRSYENPNFHKYNGLDNIKWFPNLFAEGEMVTIQEKLHGTNARASILPYAPNTLWKKFKLFIGLAPKFEKCYGSNNVEISAKTEYKGFYGEDLYGATFDSLKVFEKLRPNEAVYGEIIGPSIQKNYTYGLSEPRFVLFDVKMLDPVTGKQYWLDPDAVRAFAEIRGFEYVPVLYQGPFNKEQAYKLTFGNSVYDPKQKVREGIVIKASTGYSVEGNKKALKWVSEAYLDDASNSDFH